MTFLTFPFKPVPWQRVKRGRGGHAYVPEKTRRYKNDLALWAKKSFNKPFTGPLMVGMIFYIAKPKKPSNSYPRGDLDNYTKAVNDALNGIAWVDDSQIERSYAAKRYSTLAEAKIELTIQELNK